jgi:hypothetical protein
VDTNGIIPLHDLSIPVWTKCDGSHYQASNPGVVARILKSLEINFRDFVFVDVGSDKGRVLVLASTFGFKRVIRVEFAEELPRRSRMFLATAVAKH